MDSSFTFRSLRDLDDASLIADIRSRCVVADRVDPLSTLESVPAVDDQGASIAWALENGNQDNWRLVEAGGATVACCTVTSWTEGDGTTVYLSLGWALPDWRNQGIGISLLRWAEDRARTLAAAQPNTGKAELAGNASETETD